MDKPEIIVPEDRNKLEQQIKALEYLLTQDTNAKDKEIHQEALHELRKKLK